ncbi:MAG: DUF6249 domain-containing protein [Bacteroidales bacterium]
MEEVLIPLGFFAMIVAIVFIMAQRKVRLTLIQHGADARTLKMDKESNNSLKFGLLLIGIAVGILLGNWLALSTTMREEVAYFSMTFIFGGLSLLIYHFMARQQAKREKLERQSNEQL